MAALETQPSEHAAISRPMTVREAAVLMGYAESGARRAVREGRWPSSRESGQILVQPDILVERWAMELTHVWMGPHTRKRLAALAIAAGYPLDVEALARDCRRHLQQRQWG